MALRLTEAEAKRLGFVKDEAPVSEPIQGTPIPPTFHQKGAQVYTMSSRDHIHQSAATQQASGVVFHLMLLVVGFLAGLTLGLRLVQ
jgi:hypothetical protein